MLPAHAFVQNVPKLDTPVRPCLKRPSQNPVKCVCDLGWEKIRLNDLVSISHPELRNRGIRGDKGKSGNRYAVSVSALLSYVCAFSHYQLPCAFSHYQIQSEQGTDGQGRISLQKLELSSSLVLNDYYHIKYLSTEWLNQWGSRQRQSELAIQPVKNIWLIIGLDILLGCSHRYSSILSCW